MRAGFPFSLTRPLRSPCPPATTPLQPSGVTVRCDVERSQAANKKRGLELLKSKLLVIAQEQRLKEVAQIRGDIVKAGDWGGEVNVCVGMCVGVCAHACAGVWVHAHVLVVRCVGG